MTRVMNLAGTIMHIDDPQIEFEICDGNVVKCEILHTASFMPAEYLLCASREQATLNFVSDRVTPSSRIGINEEIVAAGLGFYDPEKLIRYNRGYDVSDKFWIKLKGEDLDFEGVKQLAIIHSREIAENLRKMHRLT